MSVTDANLAQRQRICTLGALCMLAFIQGADLSLLPSSFRAIERTLSLKPSHLGLLALCQGVAKAASGPFWGNLIDSGVSRRLVMQVGACLWGCCAIGLAFVSNLHEMALLRAFNGAVLGMLLPAMQSHVASLADEGDRGGLYGWLEFAGGVGSIMTSLIVVPIADKTVMGMHGWQFALLTVGILCLVVACAVPLLMERELRPWRPERFGLWRELRNLRQFLRLGTFDVIVLQGIFGATSAAALSFTAMYLQYIGIPDAICGMLVAVGTIGGAIGAVLGGKIGDTMAVYSPSYGRILTGLFSVTMSVPFHYMVFKAVPQGEQSAFIIAALLFLRGLLTTWEVPGAICPIIADIVPRHKLASAFSWDLAFVFIWGYTLGPTSVGWISESFFGYELTQQSIAQMAPDVRQKNATALSNAIVLAATVPALVSAVAWGFLVKTYPSEKNRCDKDAELSDSDANPLLPHANVSKNSGAVLGKSA
eukprot:TRINITY_DN64987_c0_g1_i1.p1 TRINITY_DN64987_c0_g1~~TRINITY_DN64987_c0_g1_i1.p1  ORF type:complete len:479 (-),score=99.86 TRINITY_DN64987_c0_g1_i1:4-1440(-)